MRLQARLFILLLMLPLSSAMAAEKYDDWYQIEIIVFKQKQVQKSDETWPFTTLQYPANMVDISPLDLEDLSPQTLGQLQDILAYENLVFTDEGDLSAPQVTLPADNYMFKSRSRRAPTKPSTAVLVNETKEAEYRIDPSNQNLTINQGDNNKNPEQKDNVEPVELFNLDLPQAFKALARNKHQLNGVSRSINRSSLYELLLHQAWLQPVTSESTSKPVLLQLGSHYDDNFEIDGTIKLSRSRFLHIDTDLWFTEFTPRYQQASIPLTLDLPPKAAIKYRDIVNWESNRGNYLPVHSHRLMHSRRMRRSTLHFIDHPRFGILVQVEKFNYDPEQ